ncbi:hypothetical protein SUGI_0648820 [Cryptomeria japonica]|nr:hypothetical protein SUGI_0648820 [Cryptomeria japonica]
MSTLTTLVSGPTTGRPWFSVGIKQNLDTPPLSWYYMLFTAASLLFFFCLWRRQRKTGFPLPPGPPTWPLVGNLFQLGKRPHESLYALSLKYDQLMTLHLGIGD